MTDLRSYRLVTRRITELMEEAAHLKKQDDHRSGERLRMVELLIADNEKVFAMLFNRSFDKSVDFTNDGENVQ